MPLDPVRRRATSTSTSVWAMRSWRCSATSPHSSSGSPSTRGSSMSPEPSICSARPVASPPASDSGSGTRSACRCRSGVARTKHLAKVASQVAKPDGLVVVEPDDERAFLDPLPVGLIWGVGRVTQETPAPGRYRHHRAAGRRRQSDPRASDRQGRRSQAGLIVGQHRPPPGGAPSGAKSVGAQSALGSRVPTAGAGAGDPRLPGRPGGRTPPWGQPGRPDRHRPGPLRPSPIGDPVRHVAGSPSPPP